MKKELALVAKWQKILRLQDWQIGFKYCKPWELGDRTKIGEVEVSHSYQRATISSLLPEDIEDVDDDEIEHTVVHELIHLLFFELPELSPLQGQLFERAINHTTKALIELESKAK